MKSVSFYSLASRHERFFAGLRAETLDREIERELFDPRSFSIIARDPDGRIIGHGFAALLDDERAELAFAVADEKQHHGLGTRLLRTLLDDLRARGVNHFEATTLLGNRLMRDVFAAAGFTTRVSPGSVHISLDDAIITPQ